MTGWTVERIVHFGPGDFVRDGFVHFGFHDRNGRQFGLRLNLPQISSLDYDAGRLFVPTDLAADHGDLVILRRDSPGG